MAWTIVEQSLALSFCNTTDAVLLDEYSDIVEGIIFSRYKHLIGQDTFTEVLDGDGTNFLELSNTPIISITSVNILSPVVENQSSVDITSAILIRGTRIVRKNSPFPEGYANIEVEYVGGTDTIDTRLQLAELASLAYLVKFFTANRGDDSIKFMSAPTLGQNQYSASPGIVRKIISTMDDLIPKGLKFS